MGNRANVRVTEFKSEVFLYTHWAGNELPKVIQRALKLEDRWNDGPYLTRIIFSHMTREDKFNKTTGYGISSVVGDIMDHVIHVDVDNQMIRYKEHEFTFQEFAALKTVPGWCSLK